MIKFFKAKSRLGMLNLPYKGNTLNLGVEKGSDEVLSNNFLLELGLENEIKEYVFPDAETVDSDNFELILEESEKFKNLINENIQELDTQVTVGGDHSISLSTLWALTDRIENLKVVQFDTHVDLNQVSTSPTGNVHGIYNRFFFEGFELHDIKKPSRFINPENMIFIGNLDIDPYEKEFIQENRVRLINFDSKPIRNVPAEDAEDSDELEVNRVSDSELQMLAEFSSLSHVHINFDIDVFDRELAPATGTPPEHGLLKDEVFAYLEVFLKNCKSFSFDLAEVNPDKPGGVQTVQLAQEVLKYVLEFAYPPAAKAIDEKPLDLQSSIG